MTETISIETMVDEQNEFVSGAVNEHTGRLRGFIRNRVSDAEDAEDILQDVFYEFTETTRLSEPIEQVASWLFRVARNKIIDKYRKKKTDRLDDYSAGRQNGELSSTLGS